VIALSTKRLVMRPFAVDDAGPLHSPWSSRGVRRFLWDGQTIPMAVMRYRFETLEMPVIRPSTDSANVASIRVLEKLDFSWKEAIWAR
jgi:RimJ/RimL family protein N-acetyltransferase